MIGIMEVRLSISPSIWEKNISICHQRHIAFLFEKVLRTTNIPMVN